jgi:nondiscriminating glutamyl-tRNA synthetase
MKKLNDEEVFNLCYPFIEKEYGNVDKEKAIKVIASFKEQLSYGQEIVELSRPFFNKVDYSSLGEEEKNTMSDASVKNTLKVFMEELDILTEVNGDNVKAMLKQTQIKANVKGKMLFMPLRIALTGLMHGPDFTSLIQILGVDEVKERINEYLLQA